MQIANTKADHELRQLMFLDELVSKLRIERRRQAASEGEELEEEEGVLPVVYSVAAWKESAPLSSAEQQQKRHHHARAHAGSLVKSLSSAMESSASSSSSSSSSMQQYRERLLHMQRDANLAVLRLVDQVNESRRCRMLLMSELARRLEMEKARVDRHTKLHQRTDGDT